MFVCLYRFSGAGRKSHNYNRPGARSVVQYGCREDVGVSCKSFIGVIVELYDSFLMNLNYAYNSLVYV